MKKHFNDTLILIGIVILIGCILVYVSHSNHPTTNYQKYSELIYNSTRKIPNLFYYKNVTTMIEPTNSFYDWQYFNSNEQLKHPISMAGRSCNSDRCAK